MDINTFVIIKSLFLFSMGSWLLLAAINNLVDPQTNITLLNRMMHMDELFQDDELGLGLRSRAFKNARFTSSLLVLIALFQCFVSFLLIAVGIIFFSIAIGHDLMSVGLATDLANIAVLLFSLMWFSFLIGGLWFGYWIKMGAVQIVHFTLLIISLLLTFLINHQ